MLGCQDFCGYYEWTFHYLRRKYGTPAVETFWREAIAKDSQSHYIAAGQQKLLRGLYEAWTHTGESELCDWTVAIDESRNYLRMDMRKCPSKGFLIKNDLNADEDYCDHCVGWIGPALDIIGAEVVAHEHNHCGQCWWRIRMTSASSSEPELPDDIRRDPSWQSGFIDRFERHQRMETGGTLEESFSSGEEMLVIGDAGLNTQIHRAIAALPSSVVTDSGYLKFGHNLPQPRFILLTNDLSTIRQVAVLWNKVPAEQKPLLLHTYYPSENPIHFPTLTLPRPLPVLPLLIKKRLYSHESQKPRPTTNVLVTLLALALTNRILITGIDRDEFQPLLHKYEESFSIDGPEHYDAGARLSVEVI